MIIKHKLQDYQINKNTEILILGTFLPEAFDEIDFFYGSKKNQLWDLLPSVFNEPSLADMSLQEKKRFYDEIQNRLFGFDFGNRCSP